VTLKVIGCVLFQHRFETVEDGEESDTVMVCRRCGKREVLPPGTSIVQWRAYRSGRGWRGGSGPGPWSSGSGGGP
jgi:hypothetical protein